MPQKLEISPFKSPEQKKESERTRMMIDELARVADEITQEI